MDMRVGKHILTGEGEIYLDSEECEMMKEIVRGAHLPTKRLFHKIVEEL